MTTADTGAQAPPAAASNGHLPPAEQAENCDTCATRGEIALAILGGAAGLVIFFMAIDLGSGGKLGRRLGLGRGQGEADGADAGDGNSGS
jgi:hypothetical protein